MARQARAATGIKELTVVADRGYFKSEELLQCHEAGITTFVPKPLTSGKNAEGYFGKQDFIYVAQDDEYPCPAQQRLNWRFTNVEHGMTLHCYSSSTCSTCAIRKQCTSGKQARRIKRWEHEVFVEAMQQRLDQKPDMMRIRRQAVEHPFIPDGRGALPNEDTRACQHRDEPSCARVQPQARHGDPLHRDSDATDASLRLGKHQACRVAARYSA
jgi:hypothetical protein